MNFKIVLVKMELEKSIFRQFFLNVILFSLFYSTSTMSIEPDNVFMNQSLEDESSEHQSNDDAECFDSDYDSCKGSCRQVQKEISKLGYKQIGSKLKCKKGNIVNKEDRIEGDTGHANRVDYIPRNSSDSRKLNSSECAIRCNKYSECNFFFYSTNSFCDLFKSCDNKRDAPKPGLLYQKGRIKDSSTTCVTKSTTLAVNYSTLNANTAHDGNREDYTSEKIGVKNIIFYGGLGIGIAIALVAIVFTLILINRRKRKVKGEDEDDDEDNDPTYDRVYSEIRFKKDNSSEISKVNQDEKIKVVENPYYCSDDFNGEAYFTVEVDQGQRDVVVCHKKENPYYDAS